MSSRGTFLSSLVIIWSFGRNLPAQTLIHIHIHFFLPCDVLTAQIRTFQHMLKTISTGNSLRPLVLKLGTLFYKGLNLVFMQLRVLCVHSVPRLADQSCCGSSPPKGLSLNIVWGAKPLNTLSAENFWPTKFHNKESSKPCYFKRVTKISTVFLFGLTEKYPTFNRQGTWKCHQSCPGNRSFPLHLVLTYHHL